MTDGSLSTSSSLIAVISHFFPSLRISQNCRVGASEIGFTYTLASPSVSVSADYWLLSLVCTFALGYSLVYKSHLLLSEALPDFFSFLYIFSPFICGVGLRFSTVYVNFIKKKGEKIYVSEKQFSIFSYSTDKPVIVC